MLPYKKISYNNISLIQQGPVDEMAVTPDITLRWKHHSKLQNHNVLPYGMKAVNFNWPDTRLRSHELLGGFDSSTPDSGSVNLDLYTSSVVSPVTPLLTLSDVKSSANKCDDRQSIGARRLTRSKAQHFASISTYQSNEISCDAAKLDSGIMCNSWHSLSSTSADGDSILMFAGRSDPCIPPVNKILRLENQLPKLDFEDPDSLEVILKPSLMVSAYKQNEIQATCVSQVSIGESDCEVLDVIVGKQDSYQSIINKTGAPVMRTRKSAFSDVEPSDSSDLENLPSVTGDVELFSDLLTDDSNTTFTKKCHEQNTKKGPEYLGHLKKDERKQRDIGTRMNCLKKVADQYDRDSGNSCENQSICDFGDKAKSISSGSYVDVLECWNVFPSKKKEKVYRHAKDGGSMEWSSNKCKISDSESDHQRDRKIFSADEKKTAASYSSFRVDKKKSTAETGIRLGVRDRLVSVGCGSNLRVQVNENTVESCRNLRVHSRQKSAESEGYLAVNDGQVSSEMGRSLGVRGKGETGEIGSSLRLHKRRKTVDCGKSRDVPETGKKNVNECHSLAVAKKRSCDETKDNEIYVTVESFLTSFQPKRKITKSVSQVSHKKPEKLIDIYEEETQTDVDKMKEIDDIASNYELIIE